MPKKDRKTRGRTSITQTGSTPKTSRPQTANELKTEANRPVEAGGTKHRGDRRDMNKTYTGNTRHAARGNTPRANVSTRKS